MPAAYWKNAGGDKAAGTKRMLAGELGTASETLSRTLAKFRDLKLLRISGNTFTVTNPLELQKLLQRHLGEL